MAAHPADQGTARHSGSRRECRRRRYRRRRLRGLQDGEPQPPLLHRALPGCGDRRRWHFARRLHHGRAPGGGDERAALRCAGPSENPPPGGRRGVGRRRLRQFLRRADGRRRAQFRRPLQRQHPGQRICRRHRQDRCDLPVGSQGRRPAGRLSRRQDRARWRRRRYHGFGRVRRQDRGKAPDRAGRRPVHREMPAGSLPRTDGVGRGHRNPGHGCCRPDLLGRRDGSQGRPRHPARPRQGAGARGAHVGLRNDALGESGAHVDGAAPRKGSRGRGDLHKMGPRLRYRRRDHRRPAFPHPPPGRRGRRPADQGPWRQGARIRPSLGRAEEAGAPRCQ